LVPEPSLSPSVSVGAAGYVQRDSSGGRGHGAAQVAQRRVTLPGAVFSRIPCPAYVGSEYDVVAAVLGVSGIQSGSLGTAAHAWNMLRVRAWGPVAGRYGCARNTLSSKLVPS